LEIVNAAPQKAVPNGTTTARNQDKDDGFTKRDAIERRFDEHANPGCRQNILHGIECLAVQCIEWRPMRLLRGEEMTAGSGQHIGPPVPRGDKQQNGNEDRVRGEEKRYLAVGKTQHPGGLRRQVVAGAVARTCNSVRTENPA
jgi:hypothetical protein